MRAIMALVCVGLVLSVDNATSQTDESEIDEEFGAERVAIGELLDQLRRDPIDLRTASVSELLQIPGVRRKEAMQILRAVREGEILELRAVDLVPGVRRGTAERIGPYVTIGSGADRPMMRGKVRTLASYVEQGGKIVPSRERVELRLQGPKSATSRGSTRLELRRSILPERELFAFLQVAGSSAGWGMSLGDLDVRDGSVLLDEGRQTSRMRPSEWDRRLMPDARILPGYDPATIRRGAAIQMNDERRVIQLSWTRDREGRRTGSVSWEESWPLNVSVRAVHRLGKEGTAVRLEHAGEVLRTSVESRFFRGVPAVVATAHWNGPDRTWLQASFRSLHGIHAPAVPRAGSPSSHEVGVNVAVQQSVPRGLQWTIAGDLGTITEPAGLRQKEESTSWMGVGCVVPLGEDSRFRIEASRSRRDQDEGRRWTLEWRQHLAVGWHGSVSISHRSERNSAHGRARGALAIASVQWTNGTYTAQARWITEAGDPSVVFWTMGPGPTSMSGLSRLAGGAGDLRTIVQTATSTGMEFGVFLAWSYRGSSELRSSILVEFHL